MSARTPLIAGNWKMYKTEAQAEDYIQALLPRVSAVEGVEVAICVPFTDLRAMVDSARGSRVEVYAQNMHHEPEGAFTGEISPAMLSDVGVQGVVLGHSERQGAASARPTSALALKVPAALDAGLRPILCVGETEEERDNDDTQRKLRQQVRDGLAGVADERLAEVTIAYEPIWAIGTGRVASPEQAQEAVAFVQGARRRSRQAGGGARADPLRRLGQARERRRAARAPGRRRRARRRGEPRRRVVRPDRLRGMNTSRSGSMTLPAGPDELPAPSVCLVILDGWGLAEPGPGNAVSLARTPVFDELWGTYPHTTLTACGRAVGLPDGQMGNSEVGHLNLGAGSVVRQDLVRINDAIADGTFAANPVLRAALDDAERVHLIGLVSDGGVHSSLDHLLALIACAREQAEAGSGTARGKT